MAEQVTSVVEVNNVLVVNVAPTTIEVPAYLGTRGATGTAGTSIYVGAGAPGGGLGSNGDSYIDSSNGDLYTKSGGTWSTAANLTGPQGIQGIQGPAGTDGITALTGDVTGTGPGSTAATIANDAVTNAKLNNMAAWTFKIRNNAASGDPSDAALADITTEAAPAAGDYLIGFLDTGEIRKFDVSTVGGGTTWSDPIDSNITVDTDNTYDVGTAAAALKDIYAYALKSPTGQQLTITGDTDFAFTATSGRIYFAAGNNSVELPSGDGVNPAVLKFFDPTVAAAYVALKAPTTLPNFTFNELTLPDTLGGVNYVMTTSSSGVMAFASVLKDTSDVQSVLFSSRELTDSSGTEVSLNWDTRILCDLASDPAINFSSITETVHHKDLLPDATNTLDLGSQTYTYAQGWIRYIGSDAGISMWAESGAIDMGSSAEEIQFWSYGGVVAPTVQFYSKGSFYTGIKSPDTMTASYTLTLPPDTGLANQVPKTDGAGGLTWKSSPEGVIHPQWRELTNAATETNLYNFPLREFAAGAGNQIYTTIKVSQLFDGFSDYKLRAKVLAEVSSGTVHFKCEVTLLSVDAGTVISDSSLQRTSTNSAITMTAGKNGVPQDVEFDLTSGGAIDLQALFPDDILLVRLYRDSADTATTSAYLMLGSEEIIVA